MKTPVLMAIVGALAVVALTGAVVASGTVASTFGTSPRYDGAGSCGGGGHMHQWERQYSYQYEGETGGCPMQNDWNYTWEYEYDYSFGACPCA